MGLFNSNNKQIAKPVVLISMDGVGVAPPGPGNAVTLANTPNLDRFWPTYPHGMVEASGLYVGLPEGTDGNSEVGHMTMGSGKIILQDLPRINNAINNNSFFQNPMLIKAFEHAKSTKGKVHLIGLLGNGKVHSSIKHLFQLLEIANQQKFDPEKLIIHAFLDGRDSSPTAGLELLDQLEAKCIQKKMGKIGSVSGRAFAMDRNKNWERTKMVYEMLTAGKAQVSNDWRKYVQTAYSNEISDEYVEPALIVEENNIPNLVRNGDSVIFFNFRPDRAQQLTRAFEDQNFPGWERDILQDLFFVGFTDYKNGFPLNKAFPPESITTPLGKIIADNGLKQLRIAESEKFPHVTYFFNGGISKAFDNEKWLQVPSPTDVPTYDERPEMSQDWVTQVFLENLEANEFDFILVNFAAPDMVGHTGNIEATKIAMTNCDKCIGEIVDATLAKNGAVVITADHGNAEEMIDLQTGKPDTKHSVNQVPLLIIQKGLDPIEIPVGTLADVAPTILSLLNLEKPLDMTGRNLLQ